ncbi:MAG: HD domain-containing protein [Candidatus Thorarchaeota archaeon]
MSEKDLFSKVRKFVMDNSKKDDIHGFSHTERIYELCIKIGKIFEADLFILKLAALFHDIGRIKGKKLGSKGNHAEISAQMTLNFLKRKDIEISEKNITQVIHCIRAHSFSNNIIPETLEAKILSDVDKLDALGAIGLYRTIGFTIKNQGGIDQVIEHLENKILKLKDKLYLDYSKKVADERLKIILDFYNEIMKKS